MKNNREQLIEWIEQLAPVLLQNAKKKHKLPNDLILDIYQDIMVGLIAKPPHFRDRKHFEAYFYKVFYYRLIDNLKFLKKIDQLNPINEPPEQPLQETTTFLKEIIRLIHELPQMQRTVMAKVVEGKSDETISKELEIAENTVRSHKRFARINLNRYLENR